LEKFVADQGLGNIEPNQLEVTYANHLLKGQDWTTPSDWGALLPGLVGTAGDGARHTLESLETSYRFILSGNSGRLHVQLQHGFAGVEQDSPEILSLQLTSRGGIDVAVGKDVDYGLALGHSAIVRQFTDFTGPEAHKRWERER